LRGKTVFSNIEQNLNGLEMKFISVFISFSSCTLHFNCFVFVKGVGESFEKKSIDHCGFVSRNGMHTFSLHLEIHK